MAGFNITGKLKIITLCNRFKNEFGLTLRVYDGHGLADDRKSVADIRKKIAVGEITVRKSMKVGSLEKKIAKDYGLKVQICGSDDSYFCANDDSLAMALQRDEKKMRRKAKKQEKVRSPNNSQTIADLEANKIEIEEVQDEYTKIDDHIIAELKEQEEEAEEWEYSELFKKIINSTQDFEWAAKIIKQIDISDTSCKIELAGDLAKYPAYKEWSSTLYNEILLEKDLSFDDMKGIAASVVEDFNNLGWAKKIYESAEKVIACDDEYTKAESYTTLAESILDNIRDKSWAIKVYENAEKAIACDDEDNRSESYTTLAESILDNIRDKSWAIKVYENAEKAITCDDEDTRTKSYTTLADSILENLRDKSWAIKVYENAESTVTDDTDLCLSLFTRLKDPDWARKICIKVEDNINDPNELLTLGEMIIEHLNDNDWCKKLFEKAEEELFNSEEWPGSDELVDSLVNYLHDMEWLRKFLNRAVERAIKTEDVYEVDELCYHIQTYFYDKDEWMQNISVKLADQTGEPLDEAYFGDGSIVSDTDEIDELIEKADSSYVYCYLADCLIDNIHDKKRAIEMYKKAEELASSNNDFSNLTASLEIRLHDKKWAKRINKKSYEIATSVNNLYNVADTIIWINDSDLTSDLYEIYKKIEGTVESYQEITKLASCVFSSLNDENWSIKLYKKAQMLVNSSSDFRLISTVYDEFGNDEWAMDIVKECEKICQSYDDFSQLASQLNEIKGDKDWVNLLYETAEKKCTNASEYLSLSGKILDELYDETWAFRTCKKGEALCANSKDYSKLGLIALDRFFNRSWAVECFKKAEALLEDDSDREGLAYDIKEKLKNSKWADKLMNENS